MNELDLWNKLCFTINNMSHDITVLFVWKEYSKEMKK